MVAPYIPPTTSGFDSWGANFSTLITADPPRYGLDAIAAAAIQDAFNLFHTQFLLAGTTQPGNVPVNPSARTPVTVAAMRAQLGASRTIFRTYASQIRINPGVTNDDKIALGLNLPNTDGTPIPPPISWPLLTFVSAGPLSHTFTYKDSLIAEGKAKPYGATCMQLVCLVDTTAKTDPDTFLPKQIVTKSPYMVTFDSADKGKIASYAARWQTRTGLVGNWSEVVTAIIT